MTRDHCFKHQTLNEWNLPQCRTCNLLCVPSPPTPSSSFKGELPLSPSITDVQDPWQFVPGVSSPVTWVNSTCYSGCNKLRKALQTSGSSQISESLHILFLLQDMPFLPFTTPLSKVPLLKCLLQG